MAKRLGVSRPTAYRLAKLPGFPVLLIGGRKLIPINSLEHWVNQNTGRGGGHN
ncbi:MAG: helix-turn-helix domain-containing protein [Candidatus Fimivivens sp.]